MDDKELAGAWKGSNFVFSVPRAYWNVIQEIEAKGALARVRDVNSILFYVAIPGDVLDPDKWRVIVDLQRGVLRVVPPKVITDLRDATDEPHIGVVLPRKIPINDHPVKGY